ncbi:MAG TPA: hypothetical protein VJP88_07995 [Caulobacteraceae bacterium]|nr:hypothetical protein [Caulobacteraceae bacterium]
MADEPDSLVLRMLRSMDQKIDRLAQDVCDLSVRLAHVEENLVGVHRRMDRFDLGLERIERRLELIDTPHGGVRE